VKTLDRKAILIKAVELKQKGFSNPLKTALLESVYKNPEEAEARKKCIEHYAKFVSHLDRLAEEVFDKDWKGAEMMAGAVETEAWYLPTFGCIPEDMAKDVAKYAYLLRKYAREQDFYHASEQLREIQSINEKILNKVTEIICKLK